MRVVTNTAISLDGRIAVAPEHGRGHVAIGSSVDRAYMSVLRARADAVLVGGRTFRAWPLPLVPDPSAIARLRAEGFPEADSVVGLDRPRLNVIVSRTLEVPAAGRFYEDPRVIPLFFSPSGRDAPGEVVRGEVSAAGIVAELARRGVQTLLIEAGGALIFEFLAAGLVDEVNVTVCPILIGGIGAPSLVDGAGFTAPTMPRLRLDRQIRWGDELFLRYSTVSGAA